jgi:hypothetical protein
MSMNPYLNLRLYQAGSAGEGVLLGDSYVLSKLQSDETGLPWRLDTPLTVSSQAMYDTLETPMRQQIPPFTDPLESEFSIWYLLADVKEAPKLLKSLSQSIKRLKSLAGKDGILRAAIKKHSMKEFANLRLAVVYGLLPTIADLREFSQTALKWYDTWVKKTHTFGTLRTWKGRVVLKGTSEEPTVTRLRFLAYGSAYHYADATCASGEYVLHQTLKYFFVCPELTDRMNAIKALIDASGVLDPAALWDRIPFSFVIDWFVNVSKALHGLKPRFLPVTLVVADWAESLYRKTDVLVELDYVGTTVYGSDSPRRDRLVLAKVLQQARRRHSPARPTIDPGGILGNGLSVSRILNGTCVIVGRSVRQGNPKGGRYRKREHASG